MDMDMDMDMDTDVDIDKGTKDNNDGILRCNGLLLLSQS